MTRWRKLQLGWKYRRIIRNRKKILAAAIGAAVVTLAVCAAAYGTASVRERT
jgi:hypothetical protein